MVFTFFLVFFSSLLESEPTVFRPALDPCLRMDCTERQRYSLVVSLDESMDVTATQNRKKAMSEHVVLT